MNDRKPFYDNKRPSYDNKKPMYKKRPTFDSNPTGPEMVSTLLERKFVVTVKSGGKVRKIVTTFCVVFHDSNNKKRVGVGTASAKSFIDAREQAIKSAKKSLVTFKMNKNSTLYHDVSASYHGTTVDVMHSKIGIKACPAIRKIFKMLNFNGTCKIRTGSKNPVNISKAVLLALSKHETTFDIADRCGKTHDEIINRKMCVRGESYVG
jgi:ribosomal protein S5